MTRWIVLLIVLISTPAWAETTVKIVNKTVNLAKLGEELQALALPLTGVGLDGHRSVGNRAYEPNPNIITTPGAPCVGKLLVGTSISNGVRTNDCADPGEIRFHTSRALTAVEETALDGAIAAHVSTVLTAEQQREDQDESDLTAMIATDRQTFLNHLQQWDTYNVAQRNAATKEMFQIVGKMFRLMLRRERGGAF